MKRSVATVVALALLAIPVLALGRGESALYLPGQTVLGGGLPQAAENQIAANFPGRDTLTGWSLAIRVAGGQREYNQIFISGDELIPVLDPPIDDQVSENTQAILGFAEAILEFSGQPSPPHVYTMIIPTVSAIRQQSPPSFFLGQSDQPQFIEQVYSEMLGNANITTIDAYRALFEARDQYIFYRTHNNLTSLGGFHVYYALGLGGRLIEGSSRPSLQHYNIEHVMYNFFGDLYQRSPFQNARGDILSIFRYRQVTPSREYIVTIHEGGQSRTYHTLFPLHNLDLEGREMDIFLGGLHAKTFITTSSPFNRNLLVVGDHTSLAFVPFLANHYRTITLLDLSQMGEEEFYAVSQAIGQDFYDQMLIAYSIETYMHYPYPARVLELLPQPGEYWEY